MKKITQHIFLVLASALLFSACKKPLDLTSPDNIVEENAFLDIASLQRGLTGVYAQFNGTYDNDIYATTLYTDEATLPTENNTGRGVLTYRWQVDPGSADITGAWAAYYFAVDRANRIIAAANNLTPKDATEETTLNRIKGEAIALRAFGHLQLLINFSNGYDANALSIAYMEKSEISRPGRLKVSEVVAKIKTDLQTAKALLPTSLTDRTRMTQAAIQAIQARTAVYSKNWDEAIQAATAAIAEVPLDTRTQHSLVWKDQSNAGVIWKHRREVGQSLIGDLYYDRTQQKIMYGPSQELISLFDQTNDIRYSTTVLSRGTGRPSVGKWVGGDASNPNLADIKVFRTAEMYLIRAEAYAEKSMFNEASNDLNTLRAARITGYVNQTYASRDELINQVITERFKELAFEGQRLGDLRRRLLPITRNAVDATNALGSVTLSSTDRQYYYPIPAGEILANTNMEQNPGYK
ncbi:MAG TPA: RagB/SusD family nutrient uptake outer membrane protein [Flavisolibacter sp.]